MRRITDEARRQLAHDGAAALSLRSIARELGMVSSGIYRYVASRDELLTLLIVEAYDDLGAHLERSLRGAGEGGRDRWRAVAGAARVGQAPSPRVRPALRVAGPGLRRATGHHRSRPPASTPPSPPRRRHPLPAGRPPTS